MTLPKEYKAGFVGAIVLAVVMVLLNLLGIEFFSSMLTSVIIGSLAGVISYRLME